MRGVLNTHLINIQFLNFMKNSTTLNAMGVALITGCFSAPDVKKATGFNFLTISALLMGFTSKPLDLMVSAMIGLIRNLQIIYVVIQAIVINVVDYFLFSEFSSKVLLHNKTMLVEKFFINSKNTIARLCNTPSSGWIIYGF